jgi:hypothetical protein
VLLATALTMSASLISPESAQSGDANKLLKQMSDYATSQKTMTVAYDSDTKVITANLQKMQ